MLRKKVLLGLAMALLALVCAPAPSYAARLLENCQAIGFDLRNGEAAFLMYQNQELWEIKCTATANGMIEVVKVCLDNSSQLPEATPPYSLTTPDYTYKTWKAILHESLANPLKRFAIWFEHQTQSVPANHRCKAGGYWPLIRICTISNCFLGGHF